MNALRIQEFLQLWLLEEWVCFDLVDCGDDLGGLEEFSEAADVEV